MTVAVDALVLLVSTYGGNAYAVPGSWWPTSPVWMYVSFVRHALRRQFTQGGPLPASEIGWVPVAGEAVGVAVVTAVLGAW